MSYAINGIGTTFYGARDFEPDGSHVTTKWFVVFYVPIFPIQTMRIIPVPKDRSVYLSRRYVLVGDTAPNWPQVFSVYGWFAAMIALTCVAAAYKQPWVFVPMLLMFFVPWFLRRRALKEMTGAHPLVSAN